MKKGLIIFFMVMSMCFSACGLAVPQLVMPYPQPISTNQTYAVTGSGLKYASARDAAVEKAIEQGYTKVVAEIIEIDQQTGRILVTLVLTD
jgi:hypothetical protein